MKFGDICSIGVCYIDILGVSLREIKTIEVSGCNNLEIERRNILFSWCLYNGRNLEKRHKSLRKGRI